MALNLKSPTHFTTGVLITDTGNSAAGARGTLGGTISPGAALDVKSTLGAFLPPRMTTVQRLALAPNNGAVVYDTTLNSLYSYQNGAWGALNNGANAAAKYIIQTADAGLSNAQVLGSLATGILKNTTGTGILSIAVANTDYYPQSGAFKGTVTTVAGTAYTALATDYIIQCTNGNARTITLPGAAPRGQIYIISDGANSAQANNITVQASSGTVNTGSVLVNTNWGSVRVYSDGTNYVTF